MKKILAAAALLAFASVGQAATLSVQDAVATGAFVDAVHTAPYDGEPAAITGVYNEGTFGKLVASWAGRFTATYLGAQSGDANQFELTVGGLTLDKTTLGASITAIIDAGLVPFQFVDTTKNKVAANGDVFTMADVPSFAILDQNKDIAGYGLFDFIIGFNDGYTLDRDFDDFVIGVSLAPVPLPAAAWLFGSALLGFGALGRKKRAARNVEAIAA